MPQEQDLKEYYRTIFTLKKGTRIEVLHELDYKQVAEFTVEDGVNNIIRIKGFIATPMIIDKTVKVTAKEIAAIETTLEPHITYLNTELHVASHHALKRFPEDAEKPLINHKPGCSSRRSHDPSGIVSSISECDCGAVIPTKDKYKSECHCADCQMPSTLEIMKEDK